MDTSTNSTPDPNAPVTLTIDQLNALVGTITQQVMAGLTNAGALGASGGDLGAVIGTAVADGIARNTRRRISVGEYQERQRKGRSILRRPAFQNDKAVDPGVLSNLETDLLNAITHSGRYVDRKVEVIVGSDGVEEIIYLRYHDAKPEHQFALANSGVRDFGSMLQMIVNAQTVERDERDREREVKEATKRAFGNNKNTRTAEAVAAAR